MASDRESQTVNPAKRCLHWFALPAAPLFPPKVAITARAWLKQESNIIYFYLSIPRETSKAYKTK